MDSLGDEVFQPNNNLSELVAIRELLDETEQRLSFGTWSLDISSGNMEWSDGMSRIFGYKVSAPINKSLDFYLQHVVDKDRAGYHRVIRESISNNTGFSFTYSIINGQDDELILYTKGKPVRGNAGRTLKLIGVTHDITQVRDHEQKLEEKIQELDRSNKELEEFAYIASHDLQEPLRKITSFSERLREKLGDDINQESENYLNRMLAATDNMRLLIDNLLEFSRTNRITEPSIKVDLNQLFTEVKADLELKVDESSAVIEINKLPQIEGYPSQLRQLFNNLLSNAIKFKKQDQSPFIAVSSQELTTEQKLSQHLKSNKTYYLVTVSDLGIGFEQEYAHKIFQIFQRLHGKSEYPGSGIGLAICKKIVENHKGTIHARSEPGKGSQFYLTLPEKQN
ncbi:MAG TPA: ATP-binding protein [Chryseolinea sp.]|nr:ATP-binding protein [Chryseolinea sp.]